MSLPELLIVIALIGLLVTLGLSHLRDVREAARDAVSLSNMRQHAVVLQSYTIDWRELYPQVTRPIELGESVVRGCRGTVTMPFFLATQLWPLALGGDYYDGRCEGPMFVHPGDRELDHGYFLSPTLFTRPEFWNAETRRGVEQWGPVRASEPVYPSGKASHVEFNPRSGLPVGVGDPALAATIRGGFAFLDGHAARHTGGELARPMVTGDGAFHTQGFLLLGIYGLHTEGGVRERDVLR